MTKGTTKRMIIMLIVAGVIVGGVVWFQGCLLYTSPSPRD